MSNNNGTNRELRLGEPLPPHHLATLVNRMLAHREIINNLDLDYPEPDDPRVNLVVDLEQFASPWEHPSLAGTPFSQFRGGRNRNRGRNRGGNRGGNQGSGRGKGKGGSGGGKQFPDPKVVYAEVAKLFHGKPVAGNSGNVIVFETNLEFWNVSKAKWFEDAANEVVSHCHIMFCEEVAKDGLEHTAKVAGYTAYVSPENNRHQAVGFLVHPRIKVINGPIEYDSLATVQGIPDLRPGWRLDVEDTVTGKQFSVVVLHLKSMRGGPKVTSVVRYKQLQLLVQDLGQSFVGLVGGDMNFPVNDKANFSDGDPLYQAGYKLIEPGDTRGTQIIGSRIDAYFQKGLDSEIDYYRVYPYFANPKLGRAFTDHATCEVEWLVTSKASTGGSGNGSNAGDADDDTTDQIRLTVGGHNLPPVVLRNARGRNSGKRR